MTPVTWRQYVIIAMPLRRLKSALMAAKHRENLARTHKTSPINPYPCEILSRSKSDKEIQSRRRSGGEGVVKSLLPMAP